MKTIVLLAALAPFVASPVAVASAETLSPFHASSIELGSARGSAYFVAEADGYHLVATLYANGAQTPVRFNATLADGQSASVSVPGPVGSAPQEITFSRVSNGLSVRSAPNGYAATE
jgi:hypothetical protein